MPTYICALCKGEPCTLLTDTIFIPSSCAFSLKRVDWVESPNVPNDLVGYRAGNPASAGETACVLGRDSGDGKGGDLPPERERLAAMWDRTRFVERMDESPPPKPRPMPPLNLPADHEPSPAQMWKQMGTGTGGDRPEKTCGTCIDENNPKRCEMMDCGDQEPFDGWRPKKKENRDKNAM